MTKIKEIVINEDFSSSGLFIVGMNNVIQINEYTENGEMAEVKWYSVEFSNKKDVLCFNGKYVSRVIFERD